MGFLDDIFDSYGFELDIYEKNHFQKFLEIFIEKNSKINLSAIRTPEDIIHKHFIDSLFGGVFVDLHGKVADIGTGGGFPLLPLAITHSDVSFVGIDSVAKKLRAVEDFISILGLKNVTLTSERVENLGHTQMRESFDFVTSRAMAYFPTLLEYALPLLKIGGYFLAYKLDDKEELKSAKKALSRLGGKILLIKNYKILGQKRTIVIIEKTASTHKKYPRKVGIPLKEPIV